MPLADPQMLEVIDWGWRRKGDGLHVQGVACNQAAVAIMEADLQFALRDESGGVVATAVATLNHVPPRTRVPFAVSVSPERADEVTYVGCLGCTWVDFAIAGERWGEEPDGDDTATAERDSAVA